MLVVATLRSLHQIADAAAQEAPWVDIADGPVHKSLSNRVCEQLYTRTVADNLYEVLAQKMPKGEQGMRVVLIQQQVSLATSLIVKTCREESHRRMLLEAGILDQLAAKLAAMAASDARALGSEVWRSKWQDKLSTTCLTDVLEAISAIIKGSHYRAARFVHSQPLQSVFGSLGRFGTALHATPWEKLTPRLQAMQEKSHDHHENEYPQLQAPGGRNILDEPENPLFLWLMFVARRGEGRTRLAACWLLALLRNFGEQWPLHDHPSKVTRDKYFAYLIVPLVVNMIKESYSALGESKKTRASSAQSGGEQRFILERAPLVLADLVGSSPTLQEAATDAKIISTLISILKKSFDPISTTSKQMWAPKSAPPDAHDLTIDIPSSTLGSPGSNPDIAHAFKYRESALLALAAMVDSVERLRKIVVEAGVGSHLADSLLPFPDSSSPADFSTAAKAGNPVPVLIAACTLTRCLSRSVFILRTSTIDNQLAEPMFELLRHPNIEVQLAATKVVTNMLVEMSPLREVSSFPLPWLRVCRSVLSGSLRPSVEAGV
jgi:hypothetical protein